jgi:hypothetical protein
LMRDTLVKANFSREAVERALQEPKRLRDEFAMHAMYYYLAKFSDDLAAKFAYEHADRMINARTPC